MKIKVLFLFFFIYSMSVFAQSPQNEKEAKEYLIKNIKELDPIEGVYHVENIVEVYTPYTGREIVKQNFVCAITRYPKETFFIIQSLKGDIIGTIGAIEKMGDMHNYSLLRGTGNGNVTKTLFKFTDLFSFEIISSNYYGNASSKTTTRYVKEFPTIDMYRDISTSNATSSEKSSGTGFFLNKDGYIITNYHVVENAIDGNIKVTNINGYNNKSFSVEVLVTDKQNDLAILRITDSAFSLLSDIPYTFKFNTSSIGEDCFVLGYPLISSMGKDIKLTNGIISSRTGYDGNVAQYQISAPVQAGNSGAPLFDKDGNIIGVIQAKHSLAENAGYAIKASYIRNLIDLLPTPITLPEHNILRGKTLPQQVELASKMVCIIIVNGE
ncbi:MAG: trypsin-like peptidase domain-containing protein [Muribaculaceae bacterium]|nr:trypsin-like peptidase domain-containing protein [Muribaculaceae bacterium]